MYSTDLKIGVIGSGAVGQVLASAFWSEGHPVMLGTRNVMKAEVVKWKKEHDGGTTGIFSETAAFADLIVLAVEGNVAEEVIRQADIKNFAGKTVIDTTNPIAKEAPVNGVLSFFTTQHDSLMERIQQLIPDAFVVKAFNSVGNAVMYNPKFADGKPTMFICGNDVKAKTTVKTLLDSFGYEAEDMGRAESARAIEPLCILWCIPGFLHNKWNHAFKLLKA